MRRPLPLLLGCLLTTALAGCASKPLPVLQRYAFDFKTTALFKAPCQQTDEAVSASPAADDGQEPPARAPEPKSNGEPETNLNECNSVHLAKMVEKFMAIQEADEAKGVPGDTIEEVRRKGFTIYMDQDLRVRRANTRPLYGNDALAAVGMGVSPPPLQKPEEIKAYADFMGQHYAEEYYEKDMKQIVDRLCINNRESTDIGDDRTFAILWRAGRVFKRVIKGGPINNPRQERAFLLCPGGFVSDTLTGGASNAVRSFSPVK